MTLNENDGRGIPPANYLGFTGTRTGMTPKQLAKVCEAVDNLRDCAGVSTVIHGDCKGADEQFDRLVADRGMKRIAFPAHGRPDWLRKNRAYCEVGVTHMSKPPMQRNRMIVDRAAVMLAAPKTMTEEPRSGTWAAIRYARQQKKRLVVVYPNGVLVDEF